MTRSESIVVQLNERYFSYPFRVSVNSEYVYVERHMKFLKWKFWWMIHSIEIKQDSFYTRLAIRSINERLNTIKTARQTAKPNN